MIDAAMRQPTHKQTPALKRRIRHFYALLNQREFEKCHQMIDPRLRDKPSSVTLLQYTRALSEFLQQSGRVNLLEVSVELHLHEPSQLYEGRDFAIGKSVWEDASKEQHSFSERWVREGRSWYTRSTGFVLPLSRDVVSTREGNQLAVARREK